jgi:aspartyl-tRNA(Asn)/glutamyl-tRNA(Gln) amidotransferase subunit B
LPLEITQADVDKLKANLPELPDEKRARFVQDYVLPLHVATRLVAERETANYFETVVTGGKTPRPTRRDPKLTANWVINELAGRLNKEGRDITTSPLAPTQLGAILDLIAENTISGKIAKDLFEIAYSEGGDPRAIVEQRGLKQVTDIGAIEKIVDEIVARNPDKVADARTNPKAIGWFVGQVMKASGGKANPQTVNDLLKTKIGT